MSSGRRETGAVLVERRICVFGGRADNGHHAESIEGLTDWTRYLSESGVEKIWVPNEEVLDSAEELDLETSKSTPLPRMPHKIEDCFAFLLSGTEM